MAALEARSLLTRETILPRMPYPQPGWATSRQNDGRHQIGIGGRLASESARWVHGHVHHSVDLVRLGGTRIVYNPAGTRFSNAAFQDDLVVEV